MELVINSFKSLYEYRARLLNVLAIPVLLIFLADIVYILLMYLIQREMISLVNLMSFIIKSYAYVILAVNVHRIIIIDDLSMPRFGILTPKLREFRYTGYLLLIGFLFILSKGMLGVFSGVLGFLLSLVILYILSRIVLILPATAVDSAMTMGDLWEASKEKHLLMLLVVLIFPVIFLLWMGLGLLFNFYSSIYGAFGFKVLYLFVFVVAVIFLSLVFDSIVKKDIAHTG